MKDIHLIYLLLIGIFSLSGGMLYMAAHKQHKTIHVPARSSVVIYTGDTIIVDDTQTIKLQ